MYDLFAELLLWEDTTREKWIRSMECTQRRRQQRTTTWKDEKVSFTRFPSSCHLFCHFYNMLICTIKVSLLRIHQNATTSALTTGQVEKKKQKKTKNKIVSATGIVTGEH